MKFMNASNGSNRVTNHVSIVLVQNTITLKNYSEEPMIIIFGMMFFMNKSIYYS